MINTKWRRVFTYYVSTFKAKTVHLNYQPYSSNANHDVTIPTWQISKPATGANSQLFSSHQTKLLPISKLWGWECLVIIRIKTASVQLKNSLNWYPSHLPTSKMWWQNWLTSHTKQVSLQGVCLPWIQLQSLSQKREWCCAVWCSQHSLYSCSRFFLYLCLKALGWCQVCQVSISLHKTQIFEQIFLSIVPHRVSQVNRGTSHRDGHTVLQAKIHMVLQPRLVQFIDTMGFWL